MAITPSLRYESSRLKATSAVGARLIDNRWQVGDAELTAEAYSPSFHGLRGEVIAGGSRVFVDEAGASQQLDLTGRLHLIREHGGAWIGTSVVRPLRIATVQNLNVSSGGVWTRVGPATIRASVTTFAFTKFASNDTVRSAEAVVACPASASSPATPDLPDGVSGSPLTTLASSTTSCRRESRLTDLEGGIRWEHQRFEVSMRGGHRYGAPVDVAYTSRTWGSAQAAVWLSDQLAAVAGGGREPAQPARGLPARNFYSVGLMLAYWPIPRGAVLVESPANLVRAFELRPAGVALQRITARIGGVETVEIMGDFTDWAPVPLVRRGRDQWELLAPMSPGVHQINMRIDGGKWIAPPGLPSTRDDFNGEVGVLVIKQ